MSRISNTTAFVVSRACLASATFCASRTRKTVQSQNDDTYLKGKIKWNIFTIARIYIFYSRLLNSGIYTMLEKGIHNDNNIKETVSGISSDPACKDGLIFDSQRYPWKLCQMLDIRY